MSNTSEAIDREPSNECPACQAMNLGAWYCGKQLSSQVWEAVCYECAQPSAAARQRIAALESELRLAQARIVELEANHSPRASLDEASTNPTRNKEPRP